MKIFHRKPSANFPQTPVWGIWATPYCFVASFGLHEVLIEFPKRKLTKRAADLPDWVCKNCDAPNPPINTICWHCNESASR